MPFISRLKHIERGVYSNFTLRILQVFIQLAVILLIANYFSSVQLGYYYVLNSYAGLSVFFELGITFVVMQTAAHEGASLSKEDFYTSNHKVQRLASLFNFALKWFTVTSLLFILFITCTAGFFFSGKAADSVNWKFPLFILTLAISISLFINGLYSFFEGCRFIYEVSVLKITQNLLFIVLFFLFLVNGAGLFAYGLSFITSIAITLIILTRLQLFKVIKNIFKHRMNEIRLNWMKDIFPLQWRFALSTISGFFIFQIMNLFTFKYQGAIISGKLGLTLSIVNGLTTVSMVWFGSRAPLLASMVANRRIENFQALFNKTLLSSILTHLLLAMFFFAFKFYFIDNLKLFFANKLLDNVTIAILILNTFINIIIFGIATYCRSNRQEPFLYSSLFGAFINASLSYFILKYFNVQVFCIAFLLTNLLIGIPWAIYLYKKSHSLYTTMKVF